METKAALKAGAVNSTPAKSKLLQKSKLMENSNPNFKSPEIKSVAKINKSTMKKQKPNPIMSPNKIRDRKFVVAKKNSKSKALESVNCKCKPNSNSKKCLSVAYETLRVSQDEFNKTGSEIENPNLMNKEEKLGESEAVERSGDKISAIVKRRRDKLMEVVRQSVPETGCGRVMHLVKAFENALTLPKSETGAEDGEVNEEVEDETVKVKVKVKVQIPKWELPGLRPRAPVTEFSSPDLFLTRESLGLDSSDSSCSLGSNHSQGRNSGGGRRNRRNSFESLSTLGGTRGKRRTIKATPQQPFKLKTEQRGKSKQEEFIKKVQEMMIEQENERIRVAQGLPWTTDEPECLAKPPVKETTRPVDLVLHSDTRAMERAEFDHQVQDKLAYIEQFKLERERQQKLEEEEELRRLRKELVPKAQPMPYFDKPFVPRRSERQPTMPKEPRFHNPQPKKMHGDQ